MSSEIHFVMLGPVQVQIGACVLGLGGPRAQAVLAALLLEANRVVSVDSVVGAAWGDAPPDGARVQAQNRISALRRQLREAGGVDVIDTKGSGYVLHADAGQIDVGVFECALRKADEHRSRGDLEASAAALTAALALWRGPALDGLRTDRLAAAAARLEEDRIGAQERLIDIQLQLERHHAVVGELYALTAAHPWRERLVALLMVALYRANRQPEALATYARFRARLADELGLDPDTELVQLHERVLRGDPGLALPGRRTERLHSPMPASATPATGLCTLPRAIPDFVGRDRELADLDAIGHPGEDRVAAVAVISGPPGVGKTALALQWARRAADRFPDGELYVNLHGFDADSGPTPPADAVHGLLDAFAIPAEQIPQSLEGKVRLYRSILAGRRVLVVLDNASSAEQVRPLLAGATGSMVLVTSRSQLSGLVSTEGARPVTLTLLADADARNLLARRLGTSRVAAEADAVDQIIGCCAGLPLALCVVAARAVTNPTFPLTSLAAELSDINGRLDALAGEAPASDVRSVFLWSYRRLSPDAAAVFRLLANHPGPQFGLTATASLVGMDARQVRPLLIELTRAHLLAESSPGRYTFHELLRAYAAELAHVYDGVSGCRAAVKRVLDHYLHTALRGDRLLYHHRSPIVVSDPEPGVICTALADHEQALAWFHTEHRVLRAAIELAARAGFDRHAWQTTWLVSTFLHRCGRAHDILVLHEIALAAALRLGDAEAESYARFGLGVANTALGHYDKAHQHYSRALDLFGELGNDEARAHGHLNRSITFERQGRYDGALEQAFLSLDLFRALGHESGLAKSLNAVGWFQILLDLPEEGLANCRRALAIGRRLGDRTGQALTADTMGYAHHRLGNHRHAVACYRRSIEILRDLGDHPRQIPVLDHLGDAHLAAGDAGAAWHAWRAAADLADQVNHDSDLIRAKFTHLKLADGPSWQMGQSSEVVVLGASPEMHWRLGGVTQDEHDLGVV